MKENNCVKLLVFRQIHLDEHTLARVYIHTKGVVTTISQSTHTDTTKIMKT